MKAGYKQTEVGVIPSDWDVKRLGIVSHLQRGYDLPYHNRRAGAFPIVSSSGCCDWHDQYKESAPGVVTGRYGTIGNVYFVSENYWPLNTTLFVNNFCGNDPLFISYLLQTIDFKAYSGKSGVPGINRNDLHEAMVALPPSIAEQTAIATVLSDTDELIQSLEELIAKKRLIKQGTMQELLKPKAGWVEKSLVEVGEIITGGTPATSRKEYWDGDIPWVTPTDISGKKDISNSGRQITKLGLNTIRKLPANTLLVTCIASIGKNSILREAGACNQQINALIPYNDYSVEFLYYLIESSKQYLLSKAGITATNIISKKEFSETSFFIPFSLDEQKHIAASLSGMDAAITALESKLDKYRQIKQGMMQELLTGRIRLV